MQLQKISVDELLGEVMRRPHELMNEKGFLSKMAFALADFLAIRVCVDGIAARRNDRREIELMAILRNTGPYAGKFCLVGGGIGRVKEDGTFVPESVEEALRRHFMTDLGFVIRPVESWTRPSYLAQDMRPVEGVVKKGFTPNPDSRHLIALRYLVEIVNYERAPIFGRTEVGGQEAASIHWFTAATMPAPESFGYGHHETYLACFTPANNLLP